MNTSAFTEFRRALPLLIGAALSLFAQRISAQTATARPQRTAQETNRLSTESSPSSDDTADDTAKGEIAALQETVATLREESAAAAADRRTAADEIERLRADTERQSAETDALRRTVERLEKDAAEARANPPSGYDNGFFVQTPKGALRLTVGGYVQPRYSATWQRQYKTDDTGTLVRENGDTVLEQKFSGNNFTLDAARVELRLGLLDRAEGVLSVDFASEDRETLPLPEGITLQDTATETSRAAYLMDAYGEVRIFDALRIAAGQLKVPFDLETGFDDRNTLFAHRSLMTRLYYLYAGPPAVSEDDVDYRIATDRVAAASFGRDLGAVVRGTALDERFTYGIGVFNGAGLNLENDNRDVLVSGRLAVAPLGPMSAVPTGEETSASPRVAVGIGAAYDLRAHPYPQAPTLRYNASELSTTFDATVTWRGLSAFAAISYRRADHGDAFSDKRTLFHSVGAAAQIAYNLPSLRLTPAIRYSYYTNAVRQSGNGAHEATVGLFHDAVPEHVRIGVEYSGLFPADTEASYLAPDGVYYGLCHELSFSAELGF